MSKPSMAEPTAFLTVSDMRLQICLSRGSALCASSASFLTFTLCCVLLSECPRSSPSCELQVQGELGRKLEKMLELMCEEDVLRGCVHRTLLVVVGDEHV